MSQPVVHFCSGHAKPFLVLAGGLTLMATCALGFFTWQGSVIYEQYNDSLTHNLKLYTRSLAVAYLLLFSIFTIYSGFLEQKQANRVLLLLALINIGIAVAGTLSVEDSDSVQSTLKKLKGESESSFAKSVFDDLRAMFDCCGVDQIEFWMCDGPPRATSPNSTTTSTPSTPSNPSTPSTSSTTATPVSDGCQDQVFCKCVVKIKDYIQHIRISIISLAILSSITLIISGVSVYKTYQYDETSQGAYS